MKHQISFTMICFHLSKPLMNSAVVQEMVRMIWTRIRGVEAGERRLDVVTRHLEKVGNMTHRWTHASIVSGLKRSAIATSKVLFLLINAFSIFCSFDRPGLVHFEILVIQSDLCPFSSVFLPNIRTRVCQSSVQVKLPRSQTVHTSGLDARSTCQKDNLNYGTIWSKLNFHQQFQATRKA